MKYQTDSGEIISLNPHKFVQRKKMCERLKNKFGTIVELFAGRGYLTEKLYSKFSNKSILVEREKYEELARFKKPKYTIYQMNNQKFLEENLKKIDLSNMTLIDFDAFGMPMAAINIFFRNFKVTKPFFLTLTDGTARYIQMNYHNLPTLTKTYLDNGYDFVFKRIDTRLLLRNTIVKTLQGLAYKYKFKLGFVNYADNAKTTVYMGFEVSP